MNWKSWVATIAGYVAAPYTGGASIAIGSGIAAGIEAKRAEKQASEQATAGHEQAAAAYQPYTAGGTQAFNTLAGLAGLGGGGGMGAPAPLSASQAPLVSTRGGRSQPPPTTDQTLASFGRGGQAGAPGDPTRSTQPSSYGGGGQRMLISPNGQQMAVPESSVAHYLQQGARLAGGA